MSKTIEVDFNEPTAKRIANGRYTDISNADYHAMVGVSSSGIKSALAEPQLYLKKDKLLRGYSPALEAGSALHEAVLERDKFHIANYNLPDAKIDALKCMINNSKVLFDYIVTNTANEHSFFYYDEGIDALRKVRPDAYDEPNGIVYDLKSTRYNDPDRFARDAYRLGYHVSASFYLDTLTLLGYKADHFALLVQPSESPYEPFAFEFTEDMIEEGRATYSEMIYKIYEMKKAGDYRVKFRPLDLPAWRREQLGLN